MIKEDKSFIDLYKQLLDADNGNYPVSIDTAIDCETGVKAPPNIICNVIFNKTEDMIDFSYGTVKIYLNKYEINNILSETDNDKKTITYFFYNLSTMWGIRFHLNDRKRF